MNLSRILLLVFQLLSLWETLASTFLPEVDKQCYSDPSMVVTEECSIGVETNDTATEIETKTGCQEEHSECSKWKDEGECDKNPLFMLRTCAKSCGTCLHPDHLVKTPWGEPQLVNGPYASEISLLIQSSNEYMAKVVYKDKEYQAVRNQCRNRDPYCSQWAWHGQCSSNNTWMTLNCATACQSCEMLDIQKRCPVDPNATDAWLPGDANQMFERITTEPYYEQTYGPVTIHSRPAIHQDGPWIVTLERFLTEQECDALISYGEVEGYEASYEVGKANFDGTREKRQSTTRTSSNAWCHETCANDPVVQTIFHKLENLTGISNDHSEHLQILRYNPNEYYRTHWDYIRHETKRPQGVRILTVFLYLNHVEEGGGTNFPSLWGNLTITPKRGKALIWPNVLDQDPNAMDKRTKHQALPVVRGQKFGANAWFHQRDFMTPNSIGCTA